MLRCPPGGPAKGTNLLIRCQLRMLLPRLQVNEKAMMSLGLEEPLPAGEAPKWAAKHVGTEKKHPWEDVELGPLIGQGSFGKVYRGVWNGAPVAVKVRTRALRRQPPRLC